MHPPKPNSVEPPWYGPVCPVVWEGWHREVSPYPDLGRNLAVARRLLDRQDSSTSTGYLLCPLYVDSGRPPPATQ
jgi:hypothetical protein